MKSDWLTVFLTAAIVGLLIHLFIRDEAPPQLPEIIGWTTVVDGVEDDNIEANIIQLGDQSVLIYDYASPDVGTDIYKPEYEIDNVLVTFIWFDSKTSMQEYYHSEHADEDEEIDKLMQGFSLWEPNVEKNICHIELYTVRPSAVDDNETTSIGHEVLHCVSGHYHVAW